jgi:lysozyme
MSQEVTRYAKTVESAVTNKDINEDQKAALTSFAYNVGTKAFTDSTLLKKINAGDMEGAKSEFMRWTKAGGKTDMGLINRREKELAVFAGQEVKSGDYVANVKSASPTNGTNISSTGNKLADATSMLAQLSARISASMGDEAGIQTWTDNLRREGAGA